jgi:hypothetical protein
LRKFLINLAVLSLSLLTPAAVQAISIGGSADCNSNAVISCGIGDSSQLSQAVSPKRIACLFNHFGITSEDINNFDSQAVAGSVTKTGNVIVNGRVVAKNAVTAGRQNMAGSTRFVCDNHGFFIRPPSASFVSAALPAFIVMNGSQFDFAVIASCGNPVIATPVTSHPPIVKRPVVPAQTQTQTQSQTVNITTTPEVESASTPVEQPVVTKTLPNTGPGNVFALAGATSAIGTFGHWYYNRRGRR